MIAFVTFRGLELTIDVFGRSLWSCYRPVTKLLYTQNGTNRRSAEFSSETTIPV